MQLRNLMTGELLTLETAAPLGRGGEAQVYPIQGRPDLVAKIYAPGKATTERARKLAVMLVHPPEVPQSGGDHVPLAWPSGLLTQPNDPRGVVGFLMPRAHSVAQMIDYYNPQRRLEICPLFDYRYLLRAARNLAATTRSIHARGYVIGDLKHSNVLMTQTALVTLVDTDSFQVRDPQSELLYPCRVGTPDYTPPERQHDVAPADALTPEHDLFALGVLIFQLLMEGTHPFAGVYLGEGDPPPFEERIAAGHFPYGSSPGPYRPGKRTAPAFEMLPPPLQALFLRCFEAGHHDPTARPDARIWQTALDEACRALTLCAQNPHHFYSDHLSYCPWCERRDTQLRGLDPFPAAAAPTPLPTPSPQPVPIVTTPVAPERAPVPTPAFTPPAANTGNGLLFGWVGLAAALLFGLFVISHQFAPATGDRPPIEFTPAYQTPNASQPTPILQPISVQSPNGRYWATYVDNDHTIRVARELGGNPIIRLTLPPSVFKSMKFSEDENNLIITHNDDTIRTWNIPESRYEFNSSP